MNKAEIQRPISEEERCFRVVGRAVERYPDTLARVEKNIQELFLSGQEMTPPDLVDIQPEFSRFKESMIHPLIWLDPESEPVRASQSKLMMLAVMGPSASGKDSILNLVAGDRPGIFERVRTHTTRPPRLEDQRDPKYNFVSEEKFSWLKDSRYFIETVRQGEYRYGTSIKATELAIGGDENLKIWRGELTGVEKFKQWMQEYHPEVPFLSIFVLPNMSMGAFCERLQESRGFEQALNWRFPKAIWEIHTAGEYSDVVVLNPQDPTGKPKEAAEATRLLFEHLSGKNN